VVLAAALREKRAAAGITQTQLAVQLGTKQPNVARMEEPRNVTIDSLFAALLTMGMPLTDIAGLVAEACRFGAEPPAKLRNAPAARQSTQSTVASSGNATTGTLKRQRRAKVPA
jgi:transcriptional regulator with XRE-family HTH domain